MFTPFKLCIYNIYLEKLLNIHKKIICIKTIHSHELHITLIYRQCDSEIEHIGYKYMGMAVKQGQKNGKKETEKPWDH